MKPQNKVQKSISICVSSGGDTGGILTKGRTNFTFVTDTYVTITELVGIVDHLLRLSAYTG